MEQRLHGDSVRQREVYVGSSRGALRKTIARHFQTWVRRKSFWAGLFGGGDRHDPGLTYDRARCTVAVELSTSKAARRRERQTIERTKPRDNLAVPF